MYNYSMAHDAFRRSGTVQRTLTRAPLVPSQDVSRYQAKDMPPPIYDLEHKELAFLHSFLVPTLAVVMTGGSIVLIQRIGSWLAP